MLPLLIIRPEPGASRTAAAAAALGLDAHVFPLFVIEPLAWQVPNTAAFDSVLVTSASAVRHAGAGLAELARLPCYAVGEATAAAARAHGIDPATIGRTDAQSLVDAMVASGARTILWLAGEDRSPISAGAARITPVAVYAARELAAPPQWAGAIAHPAAVMLHSARAARRAAALAGPARNHLIALAISDAVAQAAGAGWLRCAVATQPDDGAMLALASELCQTAADIEAQ